jgi:glycosyltransferase involved in cell wall biosynthesis
VDNNSSDDTRATVGSFVHYGNVRYCLETKQGLANARNRGWQEARGQYVAYIDDDCKVPEEWLAVAKDIIERVSPDVFGGPFYAFYNSPKPHWYKDSYGSHNPGNEARILKSNESTRIYGGNIFIRRSLLQNTGGFDSDLGMSGKKIAYGEEASLLRSISGNLPDQIFYYDPELYVYHLVQAKKMTMRWSVCSSFAMGRAVYRVFNGGDPPVCNRFQFIKQLVRESGGLAVDFVRGVLHRDRIRYPFVQNYIYEHTSNHILNLGMLFEQYRWSAAKQKLD